MQIDWWTFVAQIINLIILLFLLRRFLYIPVLKAVEKRQKLIADELKKASDARRKADELSAECTKKLAEIDVQKQKILSKANANAEKFTQELMIEAQEQYKDAVKNWQNKLLSQQKSFEISMSLLIADYFAKFADSALVQMADVHLSDLIIAKFVEQLPQLSDDKKQLFSDAVADSKKIIIQTSQKLSSVNLQKLQKDLFTCLQLPQNTLITTKLNSELICGVAIQSEEQVISWDLADYLQKFQRQMNEDMQQLLRRS